jgi:hypothetical protein
MAPESKYKLGDIVIEKTRPSQKMVIEQHADGIYYCRLTEAPDRKALVYLERDLKAYNLKDSIQQFKTTLV